ncbi:MAG: hypothetical protein R2862_07755 [Thermoanaerobaculia bacterium]
MARDSEVETYAAVRLKIDSWRWDGVPLHPRRKADADHGDRGPGTAEAPAAQPAEPDGRNHLRFRLSPEVTLAIGARIKRPGDEMVTEPTELRLVYRPDGEQIGAYERLLGDAMTGDGTLFARQDAVEAAWAVIEPILGTATELFEYEAGSWGPEPADRMVADFGGWHCPRAEEPAG